MKRTSYRQALALLTATLLLLLARAAVSLAQQLPIMPDRRLTPGATLPVTKEDICVPGYTRKVRNVPAAVKRQVYAEYGIASHQPGDFEVVHLISLELGGSNDIKNLWPESFKRQPWNAHVKDQIENRLHDLVCSGQLDLATAQHEIATDWIAAYKKYFQTDVPLSQARSRRGGRARVAGERSTISTPPPAGQAPAAAAGQVWVNTKSGVYWKPGTRYYGKTKQGKYMSEADAIKAGYHAARGQ